MLEGNARDYNRHATARIPPALGEGFGCVLESTHLDARTPLSICLCPVLPALALNEAEQERVIGNRLWVVREWGWYAGESVDKAAAPCALGQFANVRQQLVEVHWLLPSSPSQDASPSSSRK